MRAIEHAAAERVGVARSDAQPGDDAPMPDEEDSPDEPLWNARPSRYNVDSIRQRLDAIAESQRESQRAARRDFEKLREVVSRAVDAGNERGFTIRRVEERLNDLYTRFLTVEQRYIPKEDHEKSLAPFKKWGSWIAMLVIGGVVTAVMAMVLGKGTLR